MEDLWRVKSSGVEMDEFADMAEYKRFLQRFTDVEEGENRRRLLFGENDEGDD